MEKPRIRIDFKKNGKAVITKSSILAAVKVLEQSNNICIETTSQELINWVVLHLSLNYESKPSLDNVVYVEAHLRFTDNPRSNIFGVSDDPYKDIYVSWCQKGSVICSSDKFGGFEVSEIIPILISDLIIKSGKVRVLNLDIDDFI